MRPNTNILRIGKAVEVDKVVDTNVTLGGNVDLEATSHIYILRGVGITKQGEGFFVKGRLEDVAFPANNDVKHGRVGSVCIRGGKGVCGTGGFVRGTSAGMSGGGRLNDVQNQSI